MAMTIEQATGRLVDALRDLRADGFRVSVTIDEQLSVTPALDNSREWDARYVDLYSGDFTITED